MDIKNAQKKVREADFFLNKMIKHERWTLVVFGEREHFDFYLSAFLNAGMSVRDAFRVEQDRERNELVKKWKELWETRLTPEQRGLWDFMREDRKHEVHRSGSSRRAGTENIDLAGTHRLKSGATVTYDIPLGLLRMQLPTYYFTIDGTEQKVTEACGEYLALLKQMVEKFIAGGVAGCLLPSSS